MTPVGNRSGFEGLCSSDAGTLTLGPAALGEVVLSLGDSVFRLICLYTHILGSQSVT